MCYIRNDKSVSKCAGRAYSINYYEPVTLTVIHNHEAEPEKLACFQVIDNIKNRARNTNDNPSTIIKSCQTVLDDESSVYMTRNINLTQMVHRVRNDKPEFKNNPNTIEEVGTSLPQTLKYSYRNELFYLGK